MEIKQFEFNIFGVNTYVTWDTSSRAAAVIDPGMTNRAETKEIADFIAENELSVTHLINTHMHIDHSFGVEFIRNSYGVGLEAHPDDAFLATRLNEQAKMFHLPLSVDALTIDRELHEGDTIQFGDDSLKVLHVPGHSPGSIVLYNEKAGFVITGDVLFNGSIGRTDLPGGNHGVLLEGIADKLMTLPLSTVVYPGHGPSTTIGREIQFNPFLK